MKIVKQFHSSRYGRSPNFNWGLGDDGHLYCSSLCMGGDIIWYKWYHVSCPDIDEMKEIVKEFGNLLVFL